MKKIMRKLIKTYLKSLGKNRDCRLEFIGKRQAIRLAKLHHQWLHFMPQTCDHE